MELATQELDRTQALAAVGGDTRFLAELAGIFEAASPTLLNNIESSLTLGDLPAVSWSARLLRVSAENVQARKVADVALRLEELARKRQPGAAAVAYRTLQVEVARLKPLLAHLKGEATRFVC